MTHENKDLSLMNLGSYSCTCMQGFFQTAFNDHGGVSCESDCTIDNYSCAHCPQECSCPSGYKVSYEKFKSKVFVRRTS